MSLALIVISGGLAAATILLSLALGRIAARADAQADRQLAEAIATRA